MSASGIILLGCMSFSDVVDMLNLLYCVGQLIEFCAFLHLRRVSPNLPRPYMVPLGIVGMSVMLSFPIAFIFLVLAFSSTQALLITAVLTIGGWLVYGLLAVAKARRWCEFHDASLVENHLVNAEDVGNGNKGSSYGSI